MDKPPVHVEKLYVATYPFANDVLNLPVKDIEQAVLWYGDAFGLKEVERHESPQPAVIMERDGTRIGFAINGGEAEQEGAAILVSDIQQARAELESKGVKIGNWRVDEWDGKKFQVFFVVAPDGLCFYFHQPIEDS
ncbi:MAG: VOC family protein [Chloroflexi bacterium]|nr:VOC family protein [Chloroflexota bacterium]